MLLSKLIFTKKLFNEKKMAINWRWWVLSIINYYVLIEVLMINYILKKTLIEVIKIFEAKICELLTERLFITVLLLFFQAIKI